MMVDSEMLRCVLVLALKLLLDEILNGTLDEGVLQDDLLQAGFVDCCLAGDRVHLLLAACE